MKKHFRAIALIAATLPLTAAPALAAEPLDPRALSLGGHYTAYPNSDVNGTLSNPALLHQQRGFFFVGPNLGLSLGNNVVGANDVASLVGYGQYMASYFQYSQEVSDASKRADAKAPESVAIPSSVQTLTNQGLTVGLGLRSGLVGLKIPVPSLFGVTMPVDPPKPKPVAKKAAVQATAVATGSALASASVVATGSAMTAAATESAVTAAATGSMTTSTNSGMITSKGKLEQPTKSIVKREEPSAPTRGGLAWGALGVRAWGDGRLDLTVASPVIMKVVTNFPTLDQTLQKNIQDLKASLGSNDLNPADIGKRVNDVRNTITSKDGFGVFMKDSASDDGKRTFTIAETNRAYGTAAVTLSQPIPFPALPGFPKARASMGGAFKVFAGPGSMPVTVGSGPFTLGAPGTIKAEASINLSEPIETLSTALDDFSKDYSKASEMQGKLESFGSLDYNKAVGLKLTSRAASTMGTGVDVGAVIDLDDSLSLGASVNNVAVFWPGTETNFTSAFTNGGQPSFVPDGAAKTINFTDTEPTLFALGATYRLPLGFNLMGDFQQSMEINPVTNQSYGPSLQGGLEWNILNFLYARAGARIGGKDPMYGGGVGLNLFLTKLDLAAGTDPDFKSFNLAISTGIGF